MKNLQSRQRMVSASAVCAARPCPRSGAIAGQDAPLVKTNRWRRSSSARRREKPTFAKRQLDLLAAFSGTE
jgi:hypothetical protein